MEEYVSNSRKSKERESEQLPAEPKVGKVITGTAKTKKKNGIQKFADVFIAEDIQNVKSYVLSDIIIPTIKRALYDSFTDGLDMMLNGSSGQRYRGRNGTRYSYDKAYSRASYQRDDRNSRPKSTRSGFDYDAILFSNRGDAERVLIELEELISRYGIASVQDLYSAADLSCPYTYNDYGWTDLRTADVVRARDDDGYFIKLPKANPINH